MKMLVTALLAGAIAYSGSLLAVGSSDTPAAAPADPTLDRAQAAIQRKDWTQARAMLREAVAREPRNAEFHNLYAYSLRMGPQPDMSLVFRHYNEALAIDPRHRGAHEYLGEAYLMVGNAAKAREHLAILDKLCTMGCVEFTMLRDAIAAHERSAAKK